jgi:hypothetical protein
MGLAAGLSAGVSAVVNVKILFQGEVLQYFSTVGKDTTIALACQVRSGGTTDATNVWKNLTGGGGQGWGSLGEPGEKG